MEITEISFEGQNNKVLCRFDINDSPVGHDSLWFSLPKKFESLVSTRSDSALVALLIPAMNAGEDIHIDGTLSQRLYHNLSTPYQHVLQTIIPKLDIVDIYPNEIRPSTEKAAGVAMGFSAGIDSYSALYDYYISDVPPGYKVTHLLHNDVGDYRGEEDLFWEKFNMIRQTVDDFGLPFVPVRSNMDSFYEDLDFAQTHTVRNTSVALLLQAGIGRFLYASGFPYEEIYLGSTRHMAHADPILLPQLSTASLEAISVGNEYTRVEKTLQVSEIEETYNSLNVCIEDNTIENCSICGKCKRTILTLEIAGLLPEYADVFELDSFAELKTNYIAHILVQDNPFKREIVSFAEDSGYKFPLYSRMIAKIFSYPRLANAARRIRNFLQPDWV